MSQKYGGKYSPANSPDIAPAPRQIIGARATKIGVRANALFVLPVPIALSAFGKPATGLALALAAFGLLMVAAWLLREGLRAQEAYEARSVARRPAVPRKILASLVTGLGLGLAGFANEVGLVASSIFVALGAGLHSLSFGIDPLTHKGLGGIDTFQTNRVARAVEEAEKHLSAMSDAIRRAGDRSLERQVETFQAKARAMFRRVEDDPRDLTTARKYLSVYLLGARDATVKFADFYAQTKDATARADYAALLTDLGAHFSAQTDTMLLDDRTDLDVEIEVLRERLAREGVKAQT